MKPLKTVYMILLLSISGVAAAQSDNMKAMKDMDMKGMNMKEMNMHKDGANAAQQGDVHKATGVVKSVNAEKSTVTLAHGPVESLKWPAMTMGFSVKDKMLLDKLATGKKVEFDFVKEGSKYVVTAVK